jgi:hypothetical protein
MGQSDGYMIDGSKDAKEYAWTGAKGEKRAYGKAYADARDDKDYMKNVGKGGINYQQARMKDDADWESSKASTPALRGAGKKRPKGKTVGIKKAASKKAAKKKG